MLGGGFLPQVSKVDNIIKGDDREAQKKIFCCITHRHYDDKNTPTRREIIRNVALAVLMVPVLLLVGLPKAAYAQSLWEQSRLTGDWGGVRSQLEAAGVTVDFELTQFY